jgi:hypothetical protein
LKKNIRKKRFIKFPKLKNYQKLPKTKNNIIKQIKQYFSAIGAQCISAL